MLNLNLNSLSVKRGPAGAAPIPVPVVNFSASTTGPTAGNSVSFTDLSTNSPTAWQWEFPGGTPTGSTGQNPSITYSATGSYNVTLYAGNTGGTGSLTKTNFINVTAAPTPPVEQLFTANGTWSCCAGAVCVEVIAVGAGGGGAAGGATTVGTDNRGVAGGAGGGGGAVAIATITAAQLTSTVCVVIGAGGNGGAGVSATNPGTQGNTGTNGTASCFGGFVTAGGGCTPGDGGYVNIAPGGINGCAGVGGSAVINCGTGTVCSGGNGGGMNATDKTDINGGAAADVTGTRAPGGGAGGSTWLCGGVTFCGSGGIGRGPNTVCGISLGASGCGGNSPGGQGAVSQNYGAGGAGGASTRSGSSGAGRAGTAGVLKVIQYFS